MQAVAWGDQKILELTALTLSLGDNPGPAEQAQLTGQTRTVLGSQPWKGRGGREASGSCGPAATLESHRATLHVCSPV